MTKKVKSLEDKYKKLTAVEHVLKRPGRYLGAVKVEPVETFLIKNDKVEWTTVNYSPAYLKLFDEIISNSADFSKTEDGQHVNTIKVNVDRTTGQICVYDNGGIPVVIHSEYDQYIPEMIFGELRSGTNFDDEEDSVTTGQNGEGSTLTNIFSTEFKVETADGKNKLVTVYSNNMGDKTDAKVTKSKEKFTRISFIPDYERLEITLDDDHFNMLERRTYEIAACNTHLKVYFNDTLINFKTFANFADLFSPKADRVDFGHDRFQISVFHSDKGFQQVGFVNSSNVKNGGTHIDYIMSQIVSGIREHIKKKTRQDMKPSDIRNHFFMLSNATINNPRYDSQTKELLITQPKDWGMSLKVDEKTIKAIIKSPIVQEIILWAEHKKEMEDAIAARAKLKDASKNNVSALRSIEKYETASSKMRSQCLLFIAEGDSAAKSLQSARNPETQGVFALKGKPINVTGMKLKDILANQELESLVKILGLEIGKVQYPYNLRYGKLVISTDQDHDGIHIASLIMNIIHKLAPNLLKQDFLYKLQTPIVRVFQGKNELEFFSLKEFEEWKTKQTKPFTTTYLKGLGSNDTKYFKKYMFDEKYLIPIRYESELDDEALSIAFDAKRADDRKEFIYG
ncbi:hypothetical protein [Stenotrophomonas phage RAS14]